MGYIACWTMLPFRCNNHMYSTSILCIYSGFTTTQKRQINTTDSLPWIYLTAPLSRDHTWHASFGRRVLHWCISETFHTEIWGFWVLQGQDNSFSSFQNVDKKPEGLTNQFCTPEEFMGVNVLASSETPHLP
jgi:hypothetical protein